MSEYLGSTLKIMRNNAGLSQKEVCERLGIKQSTFSSWETGVHEPSASMLLKLCDLYGMGEAVTLFFGSTTENGDFILNKGESSIIEAFRMLPEELFKPLKDFILNLGDYFNARFHENAKKATASVDKFISHPVFLMPASAGTGSFLDSDKYELVDFPEDAIPRESNFAVKVTGDSMEPDYQDGSIVFVKQTKQLEPGEVGIFIVNNEGFLKILGDHNNLISINPAYNDIKINEWDDCRLVGKAVGIYNG